MTFTLNIKSDDAAMVDEPRGEVARILEQVARKVSEGCTSGRVHDSNGNSVGAWDLDIDEETEADRVARQAGGREDFHSDG